MKQNQLLLCVALLSACVVLLTVERASAYPYSNANAKIFTIGQSGPAANKIDILVTGDGFTAAEEAKFTQAAYDLVGRVVQVEPYKSNRSAFNFWGAFIASNVSGVAVWPQAYLDTAYRSRIDCDGTKPRIICLDTAVGLNGEQFLLGSMDVGASIVEKAQTATGGSWSFGGQDVGYVFLLVNNSTSKAGVHYDKYSALSMEPTVFTGPGIAHEIAHGAAALSGLNIADEYEQANVPPHPPADNYVNCTATSTPATVKWSGLFAPGPVPAMVPNSSCFNSCLPPVDKFTCTSDTLPPLSVTYSGCPTYTRSAGLFEGCNYDSCCTAYRPTSSCIMRQTAPTSGQTSCEPPTFCPVCAKTLDDFFRPYAAATDLYMADSTIDYGFFPSPWGIQDLSLYKLFAYPWHSADAKIIAPDPNGSVQQGNNTLQVRVRNRGINLSGGGIIGTVKLYAANANIGAPPFDPTNLSVWVQIAPAKQTPAIAACGGEQLLTWDWTPPPSQNQHTCLIATEDAAADPLPVLSPNEELAVMTSKNNNVTQRNLFVVGGVQPGQQSSSMDGNMGNYKTTPRAMRVDFDTAQLPNRSEIRFTYDMRFGPWTVTQGSVQNPAANPILIYSSTTAHTWLDSAAFPASYVAVYRLTVKLPLGTAPGDYPFCISQALLSGSVASPIDGNCYILRTP